jgi:hypothetical protein
MKCSDVIFFVFYVAIRQQIEHYKNKKSWDDVSPAKSQELKGSQLCAIVSEEYNKVPFPVRVAELRYAIYQTEIKTKKGQKNQKLEFIK